MITKADEAHLEFQKHVIRYSNTQSTVHITRGQLLLSAPPLNNFGVLYLR